MDVSDSEGSLRSEDHVIRKPEKGRGISTVSECFAELHPAVRWNVELINGHHKYISEEIPKQGFEGVPWFLLAAARKMLGQKDTLRGNMRNKRNQDRMIGELLSRARRKKKKRGKKANTETLLQKSMMERKSQGCGCANFC